MWYPSQVPACKLTGSKFSIRLFQLVAQILSDRQHCLKNSSWWQLLSCFSRFDQLFIWQQWMMAALMPVRREARLRLKKSFLSSIVSSAWQHWCQGEEEDEDCEEPKKRFPNVSSKFPQFFPHIFSYPLIFLNFSHIDAKGKKRTKIVKEPRRVLLEELAGPLQFRPWVAGPEIIMKWLAFLERIVLGFLNFNPLFLVFNVLCFM